MPETLLRRHTLFPPGVAPPDTASDDPRVGHLLASGPAVQDATIALVGFPSDGGVRRNGGRPGAARGPRALREALYRLTPDACNPGPFTALLNRTADLGDVRVSGDLERDQERLGAVVAVLLERGMTPIVVGGGHETTYGHFLGYVASGLDVHLLNLDAHADVRPLADGLGHSGSPFRQALEHPSGRASGYTVAGLQPHSTAATHAAYVRHRGALRWREELDAAAVDALADELESPTLASFDLDAVDAASAPGVSAPNPGGLSPAVWFRAAYRAGASPAVRSVDVVELSPEHDAGGRTARLAALTVWHVLRGLAEREG